MVYNKNELIVFGGFQKDKVFNDTLIYSIKDNMWNRLKSDVTILPSPRYYHSACKCGPWMVVHGGKCPQPLNDTFFFDMNEKEWLQFKITDETSYRYGHKSFFQNGYIVFIGAIDDKKEFVQPSVINTLKEWYYEDYKMIGNVPSTLFFFGQALFNSSQFFIYGGIDPITVENVSNSFYQIKLL